MRDLAPWQQPIDRTTLWHKTRREQTMLDRQIVDIAIDVGVNLPEPPSSPKYASSVPGNEDRLRGIPVVGVPGGRGGAIPRTKPGENLR